MGTPSRLRLDFEFPAHWRALHRFTMRRLAQSFLPYQPVRIGTHQLASGARTCSDRWALIERVLNRTGATSLLDLGCAEGYFVQQAASRGCIAVGIDADVRRLTIAQNTSLLNRIEGAGFVYSHITTETIEKMPSFDVVLCLSVLHHVMYEHGVDHAKKLMKAILKRTRMGLIFDMGQSNEVTHNWSSLLPTMLPSPETWIAQFLREVGFSQIETLGQTDAYKSTVHRVVFFCLP